MATNVVSAVITLCTASLKSSHALNGVVQAPSKWADAAGFSGSQASPLRAQFRKLDNGVGRSGRYGKLDAKGMLDALAEAEAFAEADTKAKAEVHRRKQRTILQKSRAASSKGADQAKGQAKRTSRKAKVTA